MAADKEGGKSGGGFKTILVAIVIALVAGGSAPWWWGKLFPPAPPPRTATMGPLESATNLSGYDISNFPANSADECSSACEKDPRCKAMTFVKHPNAVGGNLLAEGPSGAKITEPWNGFGSETFQRRALT